MAKLFESPHYIAVEGPIRVGKSTLSSILADRLHATGRHLLLCGARQQPAELMQQAEFARHVGAENICPSITDAIARANAIHRSPLPPTVQLSA